MSEIVCRPLQMWPGEYTQRRRCSPFRTGYKTIMSLLRSEIKQLRARSATIELALRESDLRLDGWPYANASIPPPVKLNIETSDGALTFATDKFDHWHDNLYAIARGLEALRKIDRYGITDRGQQYTGWLAIELSSVSADESLAFLADIGGTSTGDDVKFIIREARMAAHPDHGGNGELFAQVEIAIEHIKEADR